MGFLVSRINEIYEYKAACKDAAYDIIETIKYNLDEPAGMGCGYGLTETGWEELRDTLSHYVDGDTQSLIEQITETVNPYIFGHGEDMDVENYGYDLLADMLERKNFLNRIRFME